MPLMPPLRKPAKPPAPPMARARRYFGESDLRPGMGRSAALPPVAAPAMYADGRKQEHKKMVAMPPKMRPAAAHMADGGRRQADDYFDPGVMGDDEQAPPAKPDEGAGVAAPGHMPVIRPESVAYHDDAQSCSGCAYFAEDGNCAVLQMQVSPQGGCNAFESSAAGGDADADDNGAAARPGTPDSAGAEVY